MSAGKQGKQGKTGGKARTKEAQAKCHVQTRSTAKRGRSQLEEEIVKLDSSEPGGSI